MSIIEVNNLRKAYGTTVAVRDVSFSVEEGEIFGILGPNGAGKTTTVECIEGLRRRDGGEVRVRGRDPDHDHAALSRVVGVQLQESGLQDRLRVREAVELFGSFYDDPVPSGELLDELGLTEVADTAYVRLSGGQKQRLSIALALVGRPELVVLDELTTGLDPLGRRDTWSMVAKIRDRGVTVLLVTHIMEEAERLCDRVAVIDQGRVVAVGTPGELVGRMGGGQVVRFRLGEPIDPQQLTSLPDVRELRTWEGSPDEAGGATSYVVTGTDRVTQTVLTALSRAGVVAEDVRIERASLDDAFIAMVRENADRAVEKEGALT